MGERGLDRESQRERESKSWRERGELERVRAVKRA